MNWKNKRILLFGLGILGGGVATANWLLMKGARLVITDLKTKEQLKSSVSKIRGKVEFHLGGHKMTDIERCDVVVANPDVSINNKYIQKAIKLGKTVLNESNIFFSEFTKSVIAVTGTRGKTTTNLWTAHFISQICRARPIGNSPQHQFLKEILNQKNIDVAVTETSSFHLEYWKKQIAPQIAIITNIYQDHLNRHGTMKKYVSVKSNIFKYQSKDDVLILNKENKWTKFFLSLKPEAKVTFFSKKDIPKELRKSAVIISARYGNHNLENFLASATAAHIFGVPWEKIITASEYLPLADFRQQIMYNSKNLSIINDTTATSPDAGIAAINRFAGLDMVLITGGTDRDLDFTEWARIVKKKLSPNQVIFLEGSATEKMVKNLGPKWGKSTYATLDECFGKALNRKKKNIIFSPASKSFEKFKNEFDRGEQFNKIVNTWIKR